MNSSPPQAVTSLTPQSQAALMQPAGSGSSFNLQHILKILVRRRKIIVVCSALSFSVLASRVFYERVFHPIYAGSFTLLTSSPITSANQQESPSSASALSRGSGAKLDTSTLVEVLQSVSVRENINRQFLRRFPDSQIPNLEVSVPGPRPGTFSAPATLTVSSSGISANLVLEYLKIVEQDFLGWSRQERIQNLRDGLTFLDQQEPELKRKLAALEAARQIYSARYNTLDPLVELESLESSLQERRAEILQLNQVRSQLIDTKNSLNTASAAFRPLAFSASITSSASGATSQSIGVASSSIGYSSSLELASKNDADLQEFAKLEQAIAEARSVYSPGSSYLNNLLAKRKQLIPSLQKKQASVLNDAINKVLQDLSVANSAVNSSKLRYQELTNSLKEYNPIISEKSLIASNLDELIKSKQGFRLQLAQSNSNWKLLSPPYVSPDPVSPNVSAALLQGLLVSFAIGSAVAYLRDRLDVVYHSDVEIQEEIRLPLLAHIPYIESLLLSNAPLNKVFDPTVSVGQNEQGNYQYNRFYFQESFRNLVTSLRFSLESSSLSTLAITSSVPSEGKSTIVALLAKTYSDFGSRVLLIDADMRLPQMHKRLGLNNLNGLSSILTANASSWQDCVQHPDGWPNVGVITAGIIPPDPPRLLASHAMKQLIVDIKNHGEYDFVLIDLPPVMGLSDSLIAASYFDAVALVVSIGKVDRRLPRRALARIRECSSTCIGVIANQVIKARQSSEVGTYSGGYTYAGGGYGSSFVNKYFKGAMAPHSATQAATAYDYYVRGLGSPEQQPIGLSEADGKGSFARLSPRNVRRNLRAFSLRLTTWLDS